MSIGMHCPFWNKCPQTAKSGKFELCWNLILNENVSKFNKKNQALKNKISKYGHHGESPYMPYISNDIRFKFGKL